jgi:phosphomannomutase/phosphoglucomutase
VDEKDADLGISFDGDADRIGVIDKEGNIIWGDQLMIIFSRAILKNNPGAAIIGEVKCSQVLYDDIKKQGGRPIMWKAATPYKEQDEGDTRPVCRGDERPPLFCRQIFWF